MSDAKDVYFERWIRKKEVLQRGLEVGALVPATIV
jgi:hypothetical protein